MRTKGLLVAVAAATVVFSGHAFELVGEKDCATVVLAAKADESSKLAAAELTNHIAKITGRTLKVVTAGGDGGDAVATGAKVFIGTLDAYPGEVPAAAKDYIASAKQVEASWTGVVDGDLHFVGRHEVAELYALYHFLESKLGVIWFKAPIPEDPGEYVPKAATIVLEPFAEGREPAFEVRRLDMCCAAPLPPPYGKITAVRNGFQTPSYLMLRDLHKPDSPIYKFYRPREYRGFLGLGGGHLTFAAVSSEKYFKDHPEYFSLVDGKRVAGRQHCFSNPDVQRIVADSIIAAFHRNDDLGSYLFGLWDVMHGWCECENCRAMDAEGETAANAATRNISTRFNKFAAIVMERVRREVPDADMRIWAYAAYRTLPVGVKHDPRVKVQYCDHGRCYGHGLDDPTCARNREFYAQLNGWRAVAPKVYTYEYFTCSDPFYICHEGVEEHDIKLYHRLGMIGWKNEAEFTGSNWALPRWKGSEQRFQTNWQWLWMTGKLLWDVSLDGKELLDYAESKYYGVAYPVMKKYHALRRKIWDANPTCMGYPSGDARRPLLLNLPGAKEELLGYLDEAEQIVQVQSPSPRKEENVHSSPSDFDSDLILFRVRQDRTWLKKYWIKPNEELAEKISKAYHVCEARTAPVLDGDGSDACWAGAQYVNDFRAWWDGAGGKGPAMPEALSTHVGLLYDADNLYVLVRAKEPHPEAIVAKHERQDAPVWSGDDAIELFLAPPSVDGAYYQIVANLRSSVYDSANPGGRVSWNSGAVVKTKRTADGWTMEMKIPSARLFDIKRGDVWKMMIVRNRPHPDEITKKTSYTLGGGEHHNTGTYLPIEIGAAILRNGSFEEVDKNGVPVGWDNFGPGATLVRSGSSNALRLKNRAVWQTMWGSLGEKPFARKLNVSFRAKGPGKLDVSFLRYHDENDPRTGKYKRNFLPKYHFEPIQTTAESRFYSLDYELPANEWDSIMFYADRDPVEIDDVILKLVESR